MGAAWLLNEIIMSVKVRHIPAYSPTARIFFTHSTGRDQTRAMERPTQHTADPKTIP